MSNDIFAVTVADLRMARSGTIASVVAKLRQHAGLQGPTHKLLWLAESWQRLEVEHALGSETLGEIRIFPAQSGGGTGAIVELLRRLESEQGVGTAVAVVSYDRYVTSTAENWRGSIHVRGLPMAAFRTRLQQWATTPAPAAGFGRDTIQQVLSVLVAYLERNAVRPPKSINLADVIPAARLELPFLKGMTTTGLATAVARAGVSQGLIAMVGEKEISLPAAANTQTTPSAERTTSSPPLSEHSQGLPDEIAAVQVVHATFVTPPATAMVPSVVSAVPGATAARASDPATNQPDHSVAAARPPRPKPAERWSSALAEAKVDMDPRAVPLMRSALEALLDPNGTIKEGPITAYHLKVTLQRKPMQENASQFIAPARKIARAFVNRLIGSGSLLDEKRRAWKPTAASDAIAAVEKDYVSRILEFLLVVICEYQVRTGGGPLSRHESTLDRLARFLLGSSKPANVEEIEAAIERLIEKAQLLPDEHGKLTIPGPRSVGESGDGDAA